VGALEPRRTILGPPGRRPEDPIRSRLRTPYVNVNCPNGGFCGRPGFAIAATRRLARRFARQRRSSPGGRGGRSPSSASSWPRRVCCSVTCGGSRQPCTPPRNPPAATMASPIASVRLAVPGRRMIPLLGRLGRTITRPRNPRNPPKIPTKTSSAVRAMPPIRRVGLRAGWAAEPSSPTERALLPPTALGTFDTGPSRLR